MLQPLHQTIQVTYHYSVYFTNKLFARTNPLLKETLMHNAGVASSVLCVVDNGINAFGKKNFLGTFAPPIAVLNDAAFLTTLSDRDWCSGISEAIKVALLKDATFFDFIEQWAPLLVKRDLPAMLQVIYRCA